MHVSRLRNRLNKKSARPSTRKRSGTVGETMDLSKSLKHEVKAAAWSAAEDDNTYTVETLGRSKSGSRRRAKSWNGSRRRAKSWNGSRRRAKSWNGSERRAKPRRSSKTRWSRSSSPSKSRRSWADTMSGDSSEQEHEPSTQSATGPLVSVSESTAATTLHNFFTQPLSIRERLQIRNHYRLPNVPSTKTPQMEAFLKEKVTPATKRADKELAKIHSYVLDAVAPLAAIIDKQVTEYVSTLKKKKKTTTTT